MKTYLRQNWKRLAAANLASFAVQGIILAALVALGVDVWLSTLTAKGSSWISFTLQVLWPLLRR